MRRLIPSSRLPGDLALVYTAKAPPRAPSARIVWRHVCASGYASQDEQGMDTDEIARRVLVQRTSRYTDAGPPLGAAGSARFRIESGRVRVAYANPRPGMERELVAA